MDKETQAAMESGKPVMIFHINSVGQLNPVATTVTNHYWGNDFSPKESEAGSAADSNKPKKERKTRKSKPKAAEDKPHGVEHDTFTCGKHVTRHHLQLLFHELQEEGWLSSDNNEADFLSLFSGKVSRCEIIWCDGVGLGNLKCLFDSLLVEQLIGLPGGARSVNGVLENHFVDEKGHYITNINKGHAADSASQTIQKFVWLLKVRIDTDGIKKEFDDLVSWDPSYH